MEEMPSPLSVRPECTRISCHAALDRAAYVPFPKDTKQKHAAEFNWTGQVRTIRESDRPWMVASMPRPSRHRRVFRYEFYGLWARGPCTSRADAGLFLRGQ